MWIHPAVETELRNRIGTDIKVIFPDGLIVPGKIDRFEIRERQSLMVSVRLEDRVFVNQAEITGLLVRPDELVDTDDYHFDYELIAHSRKMESDSEDKDERCG